MGAHSGVVRREPRLACRPGASAGAFGASGSNRLDAGASGENSFEITGILANQMINVSVAITFQ